MPTTKRRIARDSPIPESGSTAYVYDTLNRLQTLTPPSAFTSGSFGFSYDALLAADADDASERGEHAYAPMTVFLT